MTVLPLAATARSSSSPTEHIRLEDLTWTEFEERAADVPYWLVVAGSVEQHGPHLPLGADTLVVERLAEISAARHGALILGTIRAGAMFAYAGWPGSQPVPAHVVTELLPALAAPAVSHSNRLLVLNGHDENHEPLLVAARGLADQHGTEVIVVEWAQLVRDVIREVSESTGEAHAGEGLTSVFLHWYPDRVRTDRIEAGVHTEPGIAQADLHAVKRAHHVTRIDRQQTPNGILGDPRLATAAKGAVITDALVSRVDTLVHERGWL
jgi:creatinine amidohydrolase/Fe(II)-dependent formamide hydrolase-like protein